jgi:hypothetical protein
MSGRVRLGPLLNPHCGNRKAPCAKSWMGNWGLPLEAPTIYPDGSKVCFLRGPAYPRSRASAKDHSKELPGNHPGINYANSGLVLLLATPSVRVS